MLGPLRWKSPSKARDHEVAFHARGNVRMAIVEDQLPVDVARVALAGRLHPPLGLELGVQRRAGDGRVEHELVEVGVVAGGVVDRLVDVFRRVVFQADDRRAQHADAVRLELADQREGVDALELDVLAVAAFDAHPHPGNAQADQLLDRVRAEDVGGAEDVERPCLVVLPHQFQEPQGALAVEEEVLVHDEERARRSMSRSSWRMTSNSSSPVW